MQNIEICDMYADFKVGLRSSYKIKLIIFSSNLLAEAKLFIILRGKLFVSCYSVMPIKRIILTITLWDAKPTFGVTMTIPILK
jgi:hypothetical protein